METPAPPPWALIAWPPVLCQATARLSYPFVHVDTRIAASGDPDGPASGQTIWCGEMTGGEAGITWDWVQVRKDVVAMADPMAVVTNLRFVGSDGGELPADESALLLNQIVFSLPWQREVVRTLNMKAA